MGDVSVGDDTVPASTEDDVESEALKAERLEHRKWWMFRKYAGRNDFINLQNLRNYLSDLYGDGVNPKRVQDIMKESLPKSFDNYHLTYQQFCGVLNTYEKDRIATSKQPGLHWEATQI